MKKLVIILFALGTTIAFAQNRSTVETRALMHGLSQSKSVEGMSQRLLERYPLIKMSDGSYTIGVIAKVDGTFNADILAEQGISVTSQIAQIVTMRVPLDKLPMLENTKGIVTFSVAHHAAPMMDRTRKDTHTDSVQDGTGVPMPFNGEGVLIGITDWGFDYTHPNINKKSNPRILRAWDQFKNSGPAPAGFNYGTEFATDEDIREAKGDTAGLYGYATHGTHVAGICGGNGTSSGHCIGQAPGAKFLLGSWYLNETSWLEQVAWMKRVAQEEGKRLVINSSWGMYNFSTLDGTSLLSQAINAYSDSGIVFVTSGGNNGDAHYHLKHVFENNNDTLKSIAAYLSSGVGQCLLYWGEPATTEQPSTGFKAGFALVSKSNPQNIYYSPLYNTDDNVEYLETYLVAGNDTIEYDIMTESANPLDERPHVLLNVSKNTGYKLMMMCMADSGHMVNVWNVGNVRNHAGNTGTDFEHSNVYGCQNGDHFYGIGEPGCAEKTITVAAHNADSYDENGVCEPGCLTNFSSYGPTLDGRNKPEISAPGLSVVSSISSWTTEGPYDAIYSGVSGGRRYIWSTMSGTSMSSPAVTGIVALMLQANPHLTTDQVREILFSTARNDAITGALHANDSVSISWGHGKADALAAVNAAYDLLSINDAAVIRPKLVLFPNPTSGSFTLRTGSNRPMPTQIYSIDGRCVMSTTVTGESTINISSLASGVYFVQVHDRAGVRTAKIVVK